MCSIEHAFPMIACLLIPGFELRAALLDRPRLALRPAALAPVEGTEPLLGPVTAVAAAAGIRPGMRLGEALATCPSLVLVEQDPARAEQAWEGVLRRLEDAGFAVEPAEPGCVYFETRGGGVGGGGGAPGAGGGARPPAEIAEAIEFPEAIDNELTLRRALTALVDTILARPERADRFVRKLAVTAKLVGGGSWRRTAT